MDPITLLSVLSGVASLGKMGYDIYNQPSGNNKANANGGFFGTTPAKNTQLSTRTPTQNQALDTLLQKGLSGIENVQSPGQAQGIDFNPIRQQAINRYNRETVPSLYERYAGMGQGGLSSTSFQNALANSASDLETNLAALESQFGMQNKQLGLQQQGQEWNQLAQLLGLGLTPQMQNMYQPERPGFGQSLTTSLAGGVGAALPDFIRLFANWMSPAKQLQEGG